MRCSGNKPILIFFNHREHRVLMILGLLPPAGGRSGAKLTSANTLIPTFPLKEEGVLVLTHQTIHLCVLCALCG